MKKLQTKRCEVLILAQKGSSIKTLKKGQTFKIKLINPHSFPVKAKLLVNSLLITESTIEPKSEAVIDSPGKNLKKIKSHFEIEVHFFYLVSKETEHTYPTYTNSSISTWSYPFAGTTINTLTRLVGDASPKTKIKYYTNTPEEGITRINTLPDERLVIKILPSESVD